MRLLKLQVLVSAVAFLFGAFKGFSFFAGDYQAAFLLTLYAAAISFVGALILTKTGLYEVIDKSQPKWLASLGAASIVLWAVLLLLHSHYSIECIKVAKLCDELKSRDFAITGIIWLGAPVFYFLKAYLRKPLA